MATTYTRKEIRLIAVLSESDPRTVVRVLAGEVVWPHKKKAILEAIAKVKGETK